MTFAAGHAGFAHGARRNRYTPTDLPCAPSLPRLQARDTDFMDQPLDIDPAAPPRVTPDGARQSLMYAEAAAAPELIARQLEKNARRVQSLATDLRNAPPRYVLTCGRGSSSNAATYARYLLGSELGVVAAPMPPAIASVYQSRRNMEGALFIAISQSGQSPDILENARSAKQDGARVLALVNDEHSPLAELADAVIPMQAGIEKSVAATKTYLASLSALLQLAAYWKGDRSMLQALESLPDAMRSAWDADWSALRHGLRKERSLLVVGRGVGLATALEAALKLKETCGLHAEAFSAAEVKHGPMALAANAIPLLLFAQADQTESGAAALAVEMRSKGIKLWTAGLDSECGVHRLPTACPHPLLAPFVQNLSFYRMVNALSFDRGYHPDTPPNLSKVTCTL